MTYVIEANQGPQGQEGTWFMKKALATGSDWTQDKDEAYEFDDSNIAYIIKLYCLPAYVNASIVETNKVA